MDCGAEGPGHIAGKGRHSKMKLINWTFLVFSSVGLLLGNLPSGCHGSKEEEKLLEDLVIEAYESNVRPVRNESEALTVYMGLSISQIIDVDERNQVMTTSLWQRQRWTDYRLEWNPADYGNITTFHIPIYLLWRPDIVLYNNVGGDYTTDKLTMTQVYPNGTVDWFPPAVYRSSCLIHINNFPFDEQSCPLKFGSWTHDYSKIDLQPISAYVGLERYWENQEWDIVETPIERHKLQYACCDNYIYVDLTFQFVLHRKSLFYIVTFVLPCIMITFLTIFVFYVPSNCGEKVTLCISILLALIVFLLLIAEMIPTTSGSIPLIGVYLLFSMAMVSVSITVTVIIINLFHRSAMTHTMPAWVRTIFIELLPPYLNMKRPDNYKLFYPTPDQQEVENSNNVQLTRMMYGRNSDADRQCFNRHPYLRGVIQRGGCMTTGPDGLPTIHNLSVDGEWPTHETEEEMLMDANVDLKRIRDNGKTPPRLKEGLEFINYIVERTKDEDKDRKIQAEWHYVAMVIDRLFLWVYIFIVTIGSMCIFLSSPLLWETDDAHVPVPREKAIHVNRTDYLMSIGKL
ncbi:neuronal acetylcholine receptor subunit alpha-3-like [Diadema antillarum]|uniref:neuronal acetylcholine receptor subunit alpha-3-like n=1 Tax=Diadema antillarum TaxID=105358 RepID=UPI003A837A3E